MQNYSPLKSQQQAIHNVSRVAFAGVMRLASRNMAVFTSGIGSGSGFARSSDICVNLSAIGTRWLQCQNFPIKLCMLVCQTFVNPLP
jgi:hypothetical protein